jgi:hypothetical protein
MSAEDDLYRLPLAEFTPARDDLARRLRREGRRDEADAVKALRKPTVAAWAVNQLAHRRPQDIERLLEVGTSLREAQGALLAGRGRAALQRASAEERELVDRLTRDATAVAGEARTSAVGTLAERIRSTLHAAALDEQTASELAAGRLVRDREAVGLFGTSVPAEARAAPARRPKQTEAREKKGRKRGDEDAQRSAERRRELERELAAARAAEKQARREHATAAKATERAGKLAEGARARAEEARARADEAGAGLRQAERREREAAKARDRAARAAAAAEKKLR